MRRSLSFKLFMAAFVAAVLALVACVAQDFVKPARAAHKSQHHASKYYPPLLDEWGIYGTFGRVGNKVKYGLIMSYSGGDNLVYPQMGRDDIIPRYQIKLLLPTGMKLLNPRSGMFKSKFQFQLYHIHYGGHPPKSDLAWHIINGVPVWQVERVAEGTLPVVKFWVEGQPGQCFHAVGQAFYHRKVKRKGRYVKVWAPIPHAPVQVTGEKCLPGTPTTTTPTTTTTTSS